MQSAFQKWLRAETFRDRCRQRQMFDLAELFEAIADIWNAALPKAVQRED